MNLHVTPFRHTKADKAGALKPLEEAAEVFGAWQLWDENKALGRSVADELADVIQASVNLLDAMGFNESMTNIAMTRCRRRNEARGRKYAVEVVESKKERTCRVRNLGGINDQVLPLLLCEECGEVNYSQANGEAWNYCPNCGAKVVEE